MSRVGEWLRRAQNFIEHGLWHFEPERRSQVGIVRFLQFCTMVGEGFVRDQLLLRASALTYFAVLSIVPMLAIASAVLTAFGVTENVLGPVIDQFAAVAPEIAERVRSVIESANIGALGTVGAVSLLGTTVLGLSNVERALNHIWGVQHQRPIASRFAWYFVALVAGPLLIGLALSIATVIADQSFVSHMLQYPLFEWGYNLGLGQLPTLVFALSFTLLYFVLPNTRVDFTGALLGGLFAAIGVHAALKAYVGFSVGVARAEALYGVFAQLPLLFVWIYTLWAIVLLGAEIAFAYQNLPSYRREVRSQDVSSADREALALHLAVVVARQFENADEPVDHQTASELLGAPVRVVRDVEARLTEEGILARRIVGDDDEAMMLGRPADRIRVSDVLAAMRGERDTLRRGPGVESLVESVLSELDENNQKGPGGRTLADLLDAVPLDGRVEPAAAPR